MTTRNAEYYYLQAQMKGTGMAYVCFALLGCHYAYLGRWGLQLLFWLTLGGLGIWAFVDLFRIPGMVNDHNWDIAEELEALDRYTHRVRR